MDTKKKKLCLNRIRLPLDEQIYAYWDLLLHVTDYAPDKVDIFGKMVAKVRQEKGWTPQELGARINMTGECIRKIENCNNKSIRKGTLIKIACSFGVSPFYLLGLTDNASKVLVTPTKEYNGKNDDKRPKGYEKTEDGRYPAINPIDFYDKVYQDSAFVAPLARKLLDEDLEMRYYMALIYRLDEHSKYVIKRYLQSILENVKIDESYG